MDIALRGRDFSDHDDKEQSRVAIVNETFARRLFPGRDAIGARFNNNGPDKPYWEIIGVAADGKYNSLGEDPKPAFYRPILRDYSTSATLVARTMRRFTGSNYRAAKRTAASGLNASGL